MKRMKWVGFVKPMVHFFGKILQNLFGNVNVMYHVGYIGVEGEK